MEPTKDEGVTENVTPITEQTGQNVVIPRKSWHWIKWHLMHGNRHYLEIESMSDKELKMSIVELLIGIHEELRTLNRDLRLEDARRR